jgi:predicted MFS family arabinose efflux permease
MSWHRIRSGLMFGIAVVASPCCAPLIVPLVLALLAGTPIAVWLSHNSGWAYGALTLISIASLVLGLRWMWRKKRAINTTPVFPVTLDRRLTDGKIR